MRPEEDRAAAERAQRERLERDARPERRWEYHVLRVGLKARADRELNELGLKGWQLAQVLEVDGHLAYYFERELPPVEATATTPDETSSAISASE